MLRTVAFVALLLACVPASAETQKSFQVSADIVAGCLVTLASGGNWGQIDLGSVSGIATGSVAANLLSNSTSGIRLQCTPGTNLSVTADTGNQPANGIRQLGIAGNPAARIPYQLYANGDTTPWTTQAVTLAFAVGTSAKTLPVRAVATLPGSQRAGAYTDSVRVTLSW